MNFQYVFGNPISAKKSQKKGSKAVAKSKKPSKISQVVKKKTKAVKASEKKKAPKKPHHKKRSKALRKAVAVISKRVAKVSSKKRRKKKVKISAIGKTSARVSSQLKGKGSEVAKKKKAKSKSHSKRKRKHSKKASSPKRRRKARRKAKSKAVAAAPKKKRAKSKKYRSFKKTYTRLVKRGRKKVRRKFRRKAVLLPKPKWGETVRVKIKAKKRGKYGMTRIKLRRHKRLYKNPIGGNMVEQYLGHSNKEAIGLVGGGLAYGAVNSLMMKIPGVSKIHEILVKVPVVGTALPTLVLGALLVKLGASKRNALLSQAGAGLVGASIVGIGVNASQLIPGLSPSVAGVDFTMNGVDYTALGQAQLGEFENNPADFGQVNTSIPEGLQGFGDSDYEEPRDGADFGEIPEGLGESQLG